MKLNEQTPPVAEHMFSGLDEIDWQSLTHAYGSAEDIPEILRELAGSDESGAREAMSELWGNIWHQGTVYPATVHAVPFLVKILQHPDCHSRDHLATLLACISVGSGFYQVHQDLHHIRKEVSDVELAAKLAQEAAYVTPAHEAVARFLPEFVDLMQDDEAMIRRSIPYLVMKIPAGKEWLLRNGIDNCRVEQDPFTLANLLFAISRSCIGKLEFAGKIAALELSDEPIVSVARSHALLAIGDSSLGNDALETVLRPLLHPEAYQEYHRVCGFGTLCSEEELFLDLLNQLAPVIRLRVITALCRILPGMDDTVASFLAESCLTSIFKIDLLPTFLDALTEAQCIILKSINRSDNCIHSDKEYLGIMHGLDKSGILKQLGIDSRQRW